MTAPAAVQEDAPLGLIDWPIVQKDYVPFASRCWWYRHGLTPTRIGGRTLWGRAQVAQWVADHLEGKGPAPAPDKAVKARAALAANRAKASLKKSSRKGR